MLCTKARVADTELPPSCTYNKVLKGARNLQGVADAIGRGQGLPSGTHLHMRW